MAIDAKMSLINQIQKGLAVEVTANAMTAVLRIISDVIHLKHIKGSILTGLRLTVSDYPVT